MITTVIVTSNRFELFKRAVTSVLEQKVPVFVVINGKDSEARRYCEELSLPFLYKKNKLTPAEARNQAIKKVSSAWIHFLDDDAYVENGFYKRALEIMSQHDCAVLGGPNLTPPGSKPFQTLSGKALSSFWGAGPCSRRYSETYEEGFCRDSSLILCNLFVKRSVFESLRFPQKFVCGEENLFLAQAEKANLSFYFSSALALPHERRASFGQFTQQIYKYGLGRGQNIQESFNCSLFHWVPLLSLILGLILLATENFDSFLFLLGTYALLNLWFSRKEWRLFFLFPVVHIMYALGCLRGTFYLGNILDGKSFFFNPSKLLGKKNL